MSGEDFERRLAALERRFARLEALVEPRPPEPTPSAHAPVTQPAAGWQGAPADAGGRMPPAPVLSPAAREAVARAAARRESALATGRQKPADEAANEDGSSLATNVLGWGGAVAFVLAAAYLIRLGIDSGWLTPLVQLSMAVVGGLLLVGAGRVLRESYPRYAGYLPACGVVILFLAIYGGHLHFGLIGSTAAVIFVASVCALSLWLCRAFSSDLYALFAVAGSYSAPLLLGGTDGTITDVVIYFSAWSVVFGLFAVWHGRRTIYLLALYLALVVFDVAWRAHAPTEWVTALVFQTVQFVIFGITTAWFSIHRQAPMTTATALLHLPALLLFYAVQYYVLDRHLPALAPWIALASVAAVWMLYVGAKRFLQAPLPGGEWLLWCYVSLVLFHAGYIESWPSAWAPWASFILVPAAAAATARRRDGLGPLWALWSVVGAVFLLNYLRVITNLDLGRVPGHSLLAIAYAVLLYAGYGLIAAREGLNEIKLLLIYSGHFSAMAAAVHLLQTPIVESTVWALLALACLGISRWKGGRILGQSSLLVFGAVAGKVLLYDLSGAKPVARIISLVVLGVAFYVGGMLYQRLARARGVVH
jgi:hypothetical protein